MEQAIILDKRCASCGNSLPKYRQVSRNGTVRLCSDRWTYCENCNPYDPETEPHKFQSRAQQLPNQFPEKVNILYMCSCRGAKKVKHHFDYSRPYDVFLLCHKCHGLEHRRINNLREERRNKNLAVTTLSGLGFRGSPILDNPKMTLAALPQVSRYG